MEWVRTDRSSFESSAPLLCPFLGVEIPIIIYTDEKEIQPDQLQALAHFLRLSPETKDLLTASLFADYRATVEAVGDGPVIDQPEEVWAFVRWTEVLIPLQGPSGSRFVFLRGDPAWEQEHGLELFFRDEQLARVDYASGAFLSTCFWDWE